MRTPRRAGLPALLITLMWMGGVFSLLLTALVPAWFYFIHVGGLRADIQAAASDVLALQQEELVVRERYLSFSSRSGATPAFVNSQGRDTGWLDDTRLVVTGWQKRDGNFLIRAMTRPEAIEGGWLPAMLLEQELGPDGNKVRETWVEG